jgi:hypothetical protein
MNGQRIRLNLEVLEGRAIPSVVLVKPPVPYLTAPVFAVAPAPVVARPTSWPAPLAPQSLHALAGSGAGTYVCNLKFSSTPTGFYFDGTATLQGMGKVHMTASIRGVGYATNSRATGQITFTNASGSVTVQLTGPVQAALAPLPSSFQYKVVAATGAYSSLRDAGQLTLTRTKDAIPIRNGIRFIETGSFRLTIA